MVWIISWFLTVDKNEKVRISREPANVVLLGGMGCEEHSS